MHLHLIWKINCEMLKILANLICGDVQLSRCMNGTPPPFFKLYPKVQSCDFLVRGGSIRRIRVLRRCLRRLRHPNETTSLVWENILGKTAAFFQLRDVGSFSWKNPGGSKFSYIKVLEEECFKNTWWLVFFDPTDADTCLSSWLSRHFTNFLKIAFPFETIRRHLIWLSSVLCQSTSDVKIRGIPLENRLSSALVQLKDPSICPPTRPISLSIPAFTEPIVEPRLLLSYNPCTKCHSSHVLSR